MIHAYANIKVNGYNSWFMRYQTDRRADTTDRITFPLAWSISTGMFHSVITLIAKTSSPTAMISTPTYCLSVYILGKTGTCQALRKVSGAPSTLTSCCPRFVVYVMQYLLTCGRVHYFSIKNSTIRPFIHNARAAKLWHQDSQNRHRGLSGVYLWRYINVYVY